jgi:hypothetical protein
MELEALNERNNKIAFLYTSKPKISTLIDSLALYSEKEILNKIDISKLPDKLLKKAALSFWLTGEAFFTITVSSEGNNPPTPIAQVYDPDKIRVTPVAGSSDRIYEQKDKDGNFAAIENCICLARLTDPKEIRGVPIINSDGTVKLFNKNHFIELFLEKVKL